jgi:dTDP-glucose 4,6-dehydratase
MNTRDMLEAVVGKRKAGFVVRTRYLLLFDGISIFLSLLIGFIAVRESVDSAYLLFQLYWAQLSLFFVLRIYFNFAFGLYSRLWRYASVHEALQIIKSGILSTAVLVTISVFALLILRIPYIRDLSFYLLDGLLYLAFLGTSRLWLRIVVNGLTTHDKRLLGSLSPHKRILIVGAGDSGTFMTRMSLENPELGIIPVGIIDENKSTLSYRIHNIPVLGGWKDIPALVKEHHINQVIIALENASQNGIDDLTRIIQQTDATARITPRMSELMSGYFPIEHIREWRQLEANEPCKAPDCSYSFQNVMITGGAGFIGSNFVHYMLEKYPDYRIVVYDKLTYAGNLDNLFGLSEKYSDRYVFVCGDICDANHVSEVIKTYNIDAILNFAAETHVDRSLMTSDAFIRTNVIGTHRLLEAAKTYKIARFHQVSTDEVYGQVLRGSFLEQDPLETRSPYSASKASADLLVNAYFVSFGVPATITRGSNNIGPYQYPEKVVPLFITSALDNKPLPVYGDGLYIRDYQYVQDHCAGIDLVLHRGAPGEIYNLGGGNEIEAVQLAKMILDKLGKPHSLIYMVKDRPGQDRRYSLNCNKIKALGWQTHWDFEKALDATIDWYLKNEWWWRKLQRGEYKHFYETQYGDRLHHAVHNIHSSTTDEHIF